MPVAEACAAVARGSWGHRSQEGELDAQCFDLIAWRENSPAGLHCGCWAVRQGAWPLETWKRGARGQEWSCILPGTEAWWSFITIEVSSPKHCRLIV